MNKVQGVGALTFFGGDRAMSSEDARLEMVIGARFDRVEEKLNSWVRGTYGASAKVQKSLDAANDRFGGLFKKADPAKALDQIFDSTRLKILDSGVARVGLFGSALENLGPAGLAAAGAVGLVVAAFAGARAAAAFADEIADTANRLHVTTDALQEYRFAIRAAGGEEKGADEALESFSVTLGKAQQGLAKSQRAFLALGVTKEQIKSFKDVDEALRAVTERIGGLGKNAQKDAIISQLGLDGLKPLLLEGVDAMEQLRAKAHDIGIVMDADIVKRGAAINDDFETMAQVIDVQIKSALVDLGPELAKLIGLIARMASGAADVADAFRSIENKRVSHLEDLRDQYKERLKNPVARLIYGKSDQENLARTEAELAARAKNNGAPPIPTGSDLIDTTKAKAGKKDRTAEQLAGRQRRADEEIFRATLAELDAQNGELRSIEERLGFSLDRLKLEEEHRALELDQLQEEYRISAGKKGLSATERKRIETLEASARDGERQQITGAALRDMEDQRLEYARLLAGMDREALGITDAMATTAAERRKLQLEILESERKEARAALKRDLGRNSNLSPEQRDAALAGFDRNTGRMRDKTVDDTRGPLEEFIDKSREVNDSLKEMAVDGLESLGSGLVDAIMQARTLGDVAKNVFRQIAADLLSSLVRKNITGPIASMLNLIPGFADGTPSAPGGLAIVGEKGPELMNVPKGAQVIPNHALRALASLQNGGPLSAAGGNSTINYRVTVDLTGANGDETIRAIAYQAASQGAQAAFAMARKQIPADMARRANQRL